MTSDRRSAPVTATMAALILASLFGLQPVVTDMFLPALPAIKTELQAPMSTTQFTMSGLMLAFGIGQLGWGPVSDRFGRRPVLLLSLALLVVASFGSSLSSSMSQLVFWRVAQGATLAAVVMTGRAIVRDLYEPHEGAMVMSRAMSGLGLCAIASPLIGGTLAHFLGWRAPLAGLACVAALALLLVWKALPETIRQRNPQALQWRALAGQMATTASHRTFRAYALLVSCTYGALFAFLSASSFVYIEVLGLSAAQYGAMMATVSLSYVFGTLHCRRLLPRWGIPGTVKRAAIFSLAGGLSMALLAYLDVQSLWAVLIPQYVFSYGHGMHQPCGQAGAVGPFPHAAGVASALAGFTMSVVAFGVGIWLGQAMDGSTRPMAYMIGFFATLTSLVACTLVQRHGDAPTLAARTAR